MDTSLRFHHEHSVKNVYCRMIFNENGNMENECRVATSQSTSEALSAKNRASVGSLSLKVSLQRSSTNRVVEFVSRELSGHAG
jgi:hypothetical protein